MNTKKFEMRFQSPELRALLWPDKKPDAQLKTEKLIQNLLGIAEEKIEKAITLFFEALTSDLIHKSSCSKLKKEFSNQVKQLKGKTAEIAVKVAQVFEEKLKQSKKKKAKMPSMLSGAQIPKVFDRFPLEDVTLCKMRARQGELFADNYKKAKAILRELKKRKALDPELQESKDQDEGLVTKQLKKRPPFELNASARIFEAYDKLNANDVRMGNNRSYLLSQCPKSAVSAGLLYDVALQQNVSVFISSLEASEAKGRCNNFWTHEKLTKIPLQNGWKIEHHVSSIIAKGAKEQDGIRDPQLIETKLVATRKTAAGEEEARVLTHIHYDGWRDRTAAPDEKLLQKLVDRIEELQKEGVKDAPFEVNCKGGIGRTGTIVAIHWIRQKIYEELEKNVGLDVITINIPELIYAMRKQRKSLVSEKEQLVQIYQATASFYERLKAQNSGGTSIYRS